MAEIGLQQYVEVMVENGWDDLDFLLDGEMFDLHGDDMNELTQLCGMKAGHAFKFRKMLNKAKSARRAPSARAYGIPAKSPPEDASQVTNIGGPSFGDLFKEPPPLPSGSAPFTQSVQIEARASMPPPPPPLSPGVPMPPPPGILGSKGALPWESEREECEMCMDHRVTHSFEPCGHKICEGCFQTYSANSLKCFKCSQPFTQCVPL